MIPTDFGFFLVIVICLFRVAYGRSWGYSRMAGFKSTLLFGNEVCWLEFCYLRQHHLPSFDCTVIPCSLFHLKFGIVFLFGCSVFIMSAFIYFLLPETKQVPIEEVFLHWQNHWFWRRTVGNGSGSSQV
ncbi:hypothetical protein NC652_016891 [Populus alba x Populus x berolinensis]|nr:hypothetical protein NC652_016891 [Populus alba x Populus x berolinensis]